MAVRPSLSGHAANRQRPNAHHPPISIRPQRKPQCPPGHIWVSDLLYIHPHAKLNPPGSGAVQRGLHLLDRVLVDLEHPPRPEIPAHGFDDRRLAHLPQCGHRREPRLGGEQLVHLRKVHRRDRVHQIPRSRPHLLVLGLHQRRQDPQAARNKHARARQHQPLLKPPPRVEHHVQHQPRNQQHQRHRQRILKEQPRPHSRPRQGNRIGHFQKRQPTLRTLCERRARAREQAHSRQPKSTSSHRHVRVCSHVSSVRGLAADLHLVLREHRTRHAPPPWPSDPTK